MVAKTNYDQPQNLPVSQNRTQIAFVQSTWSKCNNMAVASATSLLDLFSRSAGETILH